MNGTTAPPQGVDKGWTCPPLGGQPRTETPSQTIKTTTSRTRRENVHARGGGHVHPLSTPLAGWLDTLRRRNITASVDNGTVTLHGPVTRLDLDWLDRHHDAFLHATTHPAWWTAVTTGNVDQLHANDAPDGCLVRGCPGELEHYTPDALPFCAGHPPGWWKARLPNHQKAAA